MFIVYKATHVLTEKIYVGQTSDKLEFRIGQHWAEKRKMTKFNIFLHATKMSEWLWETIAIVATKKEAIDCEMYHIKKWNLYDLGLNSPSGAQNNMDARNAASERMKDMRKESPTPWNKGRHGQISYETRQLMSIAKLNNPTRIVYTEEMKLAKSLHTKNRKTIIEVSSGLEFPSISAAGRYFNIPREYVRDVVNGKRTHTGGKVFIEKDKI